MVPADAFRDQPVLTGDRVRLEPLGPAVAEEYWQALQDPEGRRLTGSHGDLTREQTDEWLRTRHLHHDRADWAVLRTEDGEYLGEAVLNDLDPDNETVGYRIALAGPHAYGRGYGTEVTRLVVGHALDTVGLHRVELEVFAHNPRAQRVYEKCGFRVEGRRRQALLWDGVRYDALVMALLRTDPR
jgi:RimJ/RimL family protein N-acetyltransferase